MCIQLPCSDSTKLPNTNSTHTCRRPQGRNTQRGQRLRLPVLLGVSPHKFLRRPTTFFRRPDNDSSCPPLLDHLTTTLTAIHATDNDDDEKDESALCFPEAMTLMRKARSHDD